MNPYFSMTNAELRDSDDPGAAAELERRKNKRADRRAARSNPVEELHDDHGLTPDQKAYIIDQLSDAPDGFFLREIHIPAHLGTVPNALYGPGAGDPPVGEDEVYYRPRGDRDWADRMISKPYRRTNYVQAIGVRTGDNFRFFTIYGGPLAPMHPDDPNNKDPEGSRRWWSQHALSDQQWQSSMPRSNPNRKHLFR